MKVLIERINDQGEGICFVDDKICFVPNCVIGDEVDIQIISKGSKFYRGRLIKIIKESDLRVKSFCKYSDICGGCNIANLSYEETINFKKNKLERVLKKFSGYLREVDIVKSPKILNYRNKVRLHVKDGVYGFYVGESNRLVSIDRCNIASDVINQFISIISKYGFMNGEVVIRSNYNDELLVNFIGNGKIRDVKTDLKIAGILQNGKIVSGSDYFVEVINGMYFTVSYDSFFQVNRDICGVLFDLLDKYILKDKVVLDLYCGVGTLGLSVAKKEKKVYGIEIVSNAILNAIKNRDINKISNAQFLLGDVAKVIDKINDKIDVVIVDPPRAGLDKKSIEVISKMRPKQIIYIACDPITLARDIKLLSDYKIDYLCGMDMFSYTHHIESFCVLKR